MKKKPIGVFLIILILIIFLNPVYNAEKAEFNIFKKNLEKTGFNEFEVKDKIVEMLEKINYSLVHNYHQKIMDFGPRYTGSENCSQAGDYIYGAFNKTGLKVRFHHWQYAGFQSRNVEATLEASEKNASIFIISAHYDCTPGSLGADDDGSGVAAVLALADVMSSYSFNNTIRFVAFSGEEVGTYGSFCYARDSYKNGDNIKAVLNLDMIGYANSSEGGKKVRFHFPKRSEWMVNSAKKIVGNYENIIDMKVEGRPNYRGSDHQAFIDYGYDAVWIAHTDGYPWANSPEDIPDHLNWSYQVKATKLLLIILSEMADEKLDIEIYLKKPYEGYVYMFGKPFFKLDILGRIWYSNLRGITFLFGKTKAEAEVITDEKVENVVFCINNDFIQWDSTPPYTCEIKNRYSSLFGKNILRVYAYSESGKVAVDEMDIIVFSL